MPEAPAFPVWQRAFRKIRLAFDTWYPWDQRKIAAKLTPLKIRELEPSDLEWCERLYSRNERRVPADRIGDFVSYLRDEGTLILIAEDATGRVATFGLHWYGNTNHAFLCYLLVDPGAHSKGVGSTLILATLALLSNDRNEKYLHLCALKPVLGFYHRLGFVNYETEDRAGLEVTYLALGPMEPQLIADCRKLLTNAGVELPDFTAAIPGPVIVSATA